MTTTSRTASGVELLHAPSPAFDAVVAAPHPEPENGGPCATCAFRPGTEANLTPWTVTLARLCVEGIEPFDCHEHPRACRGWIAAVNLRQAAGDVSADEASQQYRTVMRDAADILSKCIALAKEVDV